MTKDELIMTLEEERANAYQQYKHNLKIGLLTFIVLVGIFFLIKASSIKSRSSKILKEKLVNAICGVTFDEYQYEPKMGISVVEINSTGMVQAPDRYKAEDLIMGKYKDVAFRTSDVVLEERHERRVKTGNTYHTEVYYETYFKGRWYVFEFQRDLDFILKIREKSASGMNVKGLKKWETESILFNDKFKTYTSDEKKMFIVLTPQIIEKLIQIESVNKGLILFAFINNQLHIGVNDNRDYLEVKLKRPINSESFDIFASQINFIGAVINDLKLDSSKFMDSGNIIL